MKGEVFRRTHSSMIFFPLRLFFFFASIQEKYSRDLKLTKTCFHVMRLIKSIKFSLVNRRHLCQLFLVLLEVKGFHSESSWHHSLLCHQASPLMSARATDGGSSAPHANCQDETEVVSALTLCCLLSQPGSKYSSNVHKAFRSFQLLCLRHGPAVRLCAF